MYKSEKMDFTEMSLKIIIIFYSLRVHCVLASGVCACVCVCVHSVVSNSLPPRGLQPTRLLCPQNFPGKNTRVGYHFLLQGIFPTQGLNLCLSSLLYQQVDSLPLVPPYYVLLRLFSSSKRQVMLNLYKFNKERLKNREAKLLIHSCCCCCCCC